MRVARLRKFLDNIEEKGGVEEGGRKGSKEGEGGSGKGSKEGEGRGRKGSREEGGGGKEGKVG